MNELEKEIENRKLKKWISKPLTYVKDIVSFLASLPTAKIEGIEYSLGGLASIDKSKAIATTYQETIFVFENSINSNSFGRLLSYYSNSEPGKMPTIVVVAHKDMSQLQDKLLRYDDNFAFHEIYGSTSRFWESKKKRVSMSLSDLIQELVENNTLAVANTEFSLNDVDPTDLEQLSQNLSAAFAVIRSVNFELNKFATADMTVKALKLLNETKISGLSKGQKKAFYAFQVLFILWDLYLNENDTERLDKAIRLSSQIGSELLMAHCQRLINLHGGYSDYPAKDSKRQNSYSGGLIKIQWQSTVRTTHF